MRSQLQLSRPLRSSSRSFIILLLAMVSVTAVLSVLVLAFKTNALLIYRNATDNGNDETVSLLRPDGENGGLTLAQYPQYLNRSTVNPTRAASGVSLGLALGMGLLCMFVGRRAKALLLSSSQRLWLFLALGGNCVLSLTVFVICIVQHFQSGKFKPGYRSQATNYQTYGLDSKYDRGSFDLASWSCQVSAYAAFNDSRLVLSRQCTDETAALWIGLFLVLSNLGMASLVWTDWRGARILVRDHTSVVDEHEDDYV